MDGELPVDSIAVESNGFGFGLLLGGSAPRSWWPLKLKAKVLGGPAELTTSKKMGIREMCLHQLL
jgi:hypothetical protein